MKQKTPEQLALHISKTMDAYDLRNFRSVVVLIILQQRAHTGTELARLLACTTANITGICDTLIARDLIFSQRPAFDRRKKYYRLTNRGVEFLGAYHDR